MSPLSEFKSPYPPVQVPETSYYAFLVKHGIQSRYSPDTPAQIDGITGEARSRGQLEEECLLLASGFRNIHRKGLEELRRGSVVLVFSPNSILYSLIQLALVSPGSSRAVSREMI